jgi:hypothetical protein
MTLAVHHGRMNGAFSQERSEASEPQATGSGPSGAVPSLRSGRLRNAE